MDFSLCIGHIKQLMEGYHSDELPSIFPSISDDNIINVLDNIQNNRSFYPYFKGCNRSTLNLVMFNDDDHRYCSAYTNTKSKGFEPSHFFTFKNNNTLRELSDVNIIGYLSFVYNTIIMTMPFFENVYLSIPHLDCSLSRIFADNRYYVRTVYGEWEEEMENQFINRFNFENKLEKEFEVERNKLYVLRLDIANFYSSIYSHLISRIGKKDVFAECDDKELYFDYLDNYSMYINLSETKGIPTGPFSSRVISELLMCYIDDSILEKIDNGIAYLRSVDDMAFYAKTKGELESIKRVIEKILYDNKLSISDSKIKISRCVDDCSEDDSVLCDSLINSLSLDSDAVELTNLSKFKETFSKLIAEKSHVALKSAFTRLKNDLFKNEEHRNKLKNNIDFASLMFKISLSEPFLGSRCCKIIDILLDYSDDMFRSILISIFFDYLDIIDNNYQDTVLQVWIYYFINDYGDDSVKVDLLNRYVSMPSRNPILSTTMVSSDHAVNEIIYNCLLNDYNAIDGINNSELPEKAFNSKFSIPIIKLCACDPAIYSKVQSNVPQIIIDLFGLEQLEY